MEQCCGGPLGASLEGGERCIAFDKRGALESTQTRVVVLKNWGEPMKIAELDTHVVAIPPPYVGGMCWIFVRVRTEYGIEGVGEIYATAFHARAIVPLIRDVFERHLLGHDPHRIERFWRSAYSSGFTQCPSGNKLSL